MRNAAFHFRDYCRLPPSRSFPVVSGLLLAQSGLPNFDSSNAASRSWKLSCWRTRSRPHVSRAIRPSEMGGKRQAPDASQRGRGTGCRRVNAAARQKCVPQ